MKTLTQAVPHVAIVAMLGVAAAGCTPTVKVKHEVEPIHVTADINIRVDRQLEDFFAYQDQPNAATQPATAPATPTASAAPTEEAR